MKAALTFIALMIASYFYFYEKPKPFIVLASTTSTEDSGLLRAIIPNFKAKTGVDVKVIAVGTGQAFKITEKGDADVLLVHDKQGELEFVAKGFGYDRRDVMYNDFVLVGDKNEPKISSMNEALRDIFAQNKLFVSRGDDSGTHRKEVSLWKSADHNPKNQAWYKEVGSGMGASLNIAASMKATILTDRATWASFQNKQNMHIIVEGDKSLLNPYGSILAKKHKPEAKLWHEWITSSEGKRAITGYKLNGAQLFFVN